MPRPHASFETIVKRFWSKVLKTETCWEWQGELARGYGRLWWSPERIQAHRFSWELHYGKIPEGLAVCHKCDNRKCVRPDHLFLGTDKDNAQDREAKGRGKPPTKLTQDNVFEIRKRLQSGEVGAQLAREFSIARSTVTQIRNGLTWKSVVVPAE